jgi:hypothetical protein
MSIRVNRPVIKQLSVRAQEIQREGSVILDVQTKLEPLLLMHLAHYKLSKME